VHKSDKPEGEKYGWHVQETSYPFATKWLKLREDHVALDGDGNITFTYVDSAGAVGVVPVTPGGDIVLISQYRYTVDTVCYEVPAGGLHDTGDASLEQAARDELLQETGGVCREMVYAGFFYAAPGHSSLVFHVYLALDVELNEEQHLEPTESIEVCPVPAAEALRMAHAGEIKDGPSALCVLLCENLLRERGYVS
jgi:ADP-ribose pyrophosphatase